MALSTVLVLGHSFVRRLKSDLKFQLDSRMSPSFKLDGTARIYMHGIGGRTVTKLRKYDFGVDFGFFTIIPRYCYPGDWHQRFVLLTTRSGRLGN